MKTHTHPMDYNHRNRWNKADHVYQTYMCIECGGYTLPSLDEPGKALCGSCRKTVALCGVPETHTAEFRQALREPSIYKTERAFNLAHSFIEAHVNASYGVLDLRNDPRTPDQIELDTLAAEWRETYNDIDF